MQFPFSRSTNAHVDLSSQDAFNDGAPFATFDRMRREDPMAWSEMVNGDKGFWSVTMYDTDYFFVANPINRYSISARQKLKANADGSVDLYIQNESPGADKEANWLPARHCDA